MSLRTLAVISLAFVVCSAARSEDSVIGRATIEGVVAGPDGTGLEGARVDVSTAAPRIGRGLFCPSCYLDCAKVATTDDEGRFAIESVDPTLKFRLIVAKPGFRTLQTELIDPLIGPVSLKLEEGAKDVDPARVVSGIVTHNGAPVVGALVEPFGAKAARGRWWGLVEGVESIVTDEMGCFAMVLPEDFEGVDIEITSHGICGEQFSLLEPGKEPISIEARTGASVTGRLVSGGNPVAGMSVAVVQLERGAGQGIFIKAVGAVTDDDGRFEFHYLPPDQRYCIYSLVGEAKQTESPHILTTKTVAVPASGETRDLGALEVAAPLSIRGKVERADGEPLPENLKLTLGREPAWDLISIPVQEDGSFEATGLPPEVYEIYVGDRTLAIDADRMPYQLLSGSSFGVRLDKSLDDLVIRVKDAVRAPAETP